MAEPPASPTPPAPPNHRTKRERSTRYPGVTLAESIKLCESVEDLGVDGLSAPDIASALGYKNIKTNTFSARLSAARQFGLMTLTGEGYALTPLARAILHPVDPSELPRLYRQALGKPPLYAELAERLGGKKVPDATILGNVLYHNYHIIASAKQQAAEAFLESARFAGALGSDGVLHPEGHPETSPAPADLPSSDTPGAAAVADGPGAPSARALPAAHAPRAPSSDVRLDLRLWDADQGKTIRLRAPQSITPASFERFLQAFRLLVKVEEPADRNAVGPRPPGPVGPPATGSSG
jgi:hypothetical protein